MSVKSRQDEGAFGSVLALLVVGGFIALAAQLTDGGPVETIILEPADVAPISSSMPAPDLDTPELIADRVLSQR